jgi:hypothetical protein
LIVLFGVILSILDYGNFEFNDDPAIRNIQFTSFGPDKEYLLLNKLIARCVVVLRTSVGDFSFDTSTYLTNFQNQFFWIIFFIMCAVTCIIFMNFIVAEVSATYQKVKDKI